MMIGIRQNLSLAGFQRGVAALELALILPVLLIMLSGIIEYGRALWYYDALAKGVRDAARYLSTVPTPNLGSAANLTNLCTNSITPAYCFVSNTAGQAGVTGLNPVAHVTVTCAPTACGSAVSAASVTTVTVAVSYPFVVGSWIPLFGPSPGDAPSTFTTTLSPHVTMRYMW